MSNLDIHALTTVKFNLEQPELARVFEHNKKVLSTFDERVSKNFLGIIKENGGQLKRVNDAKWPANWIITQELSPLVNTLATTFNTQLSICKDQIERFKERFEDNYDSIKTEDVLPITKSISELNRMFNELTIINDSYAYRYGDVPNKESLNQTIQNAIPWRFQRNPGKTYAPQNATLTTLNTLCNEYRNSVMEITGNWNEALKTLNKEGLIPFPDLVRSDPSLKKDKGFVLSILQDLNPSQKTDIFNACDPSLQKDPDILMAMHFISPALEKRDVPAEVQAKVSGINQGQLGKRFNTISSTDDATSAYDKMLQTIQKREHAQKHPQELDEKH